MSVRLPSQNCEPAAHPAKFSPVILDAIADLARDAIPTHSTVLDPFAGVGRIHDLGDRMGWHTTGVEIEPEWAAHHPQTYVGDSTALPLDWTGFFDAAIWSPVYGNRMCLVGDTLVLTKRGYIPIKDVIIGDRVLTHRGRWKRVLSSGPTGVREVVRVTGQIAGSITCTPDHPLLVAQRTSTKSQALCLGEIGWKDAGDAVGDYWLSPTRTDRSSMPVPPEGFAYSADFWWAVGMWLADGWGYHGTHPATEAWTRSSVFWCSSKEQGPEVEARLRSLVGSRLAPSSAHITQSVEAWVLYSQPLLRWLYEHFGRTAKGKSLPGWCLSLPRHQREALIEGYLYGDGCETKDRDRNVASSVSKPLLRGMQMIAHTLGWSTSLTQSKQARREMVAGSECECAPAWALRIVRRPTRRTHEVEGYLATKVRSVEDAGLEVVFDIEVEEDHSFVAEGVIVHNSDAHNAQERCKPCGASGQIDGAPCEKCGGTGRRTYKRNTYKHTLDRRRDDGTVDDLHPNNAGAMKFQQEAYKDLHRRVYAEVARVTKPQAVAVINVSNFLRAKGTEEVDVTGWHVEALRHVGFTEVRRVEVETPRNGHGANRDLRCAFESVILLDKRRTV